MIKADGLIPDVCHRSYGPSRYGWNPSPFSPSCSCCSERAKPKRSRRTICSRWGFTGRCTYPIGCIDTLQRAMSIRSLGSPARSRQFSTLIFSGFTIPSMLFPFFFVPSKFPEHYTPVCYTTQVLIKNGLLTTLFPLGCYKARNSTFPFKSACWRQGGGGRGKHSNNGAGACIPTYFFDLNPNCIYTFSCFPPSLSGGMARGAKKTDRKSVV